MDTLVTVTGNLTSDPVQRVTASGAIVVGLRIASSPRRWDRESMQWRDGDPMFISASCWRQLAGNVMASLRKGDSVMVHGRLSMRTYEDKLGARRSVHEIDAVAIGPDLTRCPAEVRRPARSADTVSGTAAPVEGSVDGQPATPVPAEVSGAGIPQQSAAGRPDESTQSAAERGSQTPDPVEAAA
jgi:single-strand DNA-binding protein